MPFQKPSLERICGASSNFIHALIPTPRFAFVSTIFPVRQRPNFNTTPTPQTDIIRDTKTPKTRMTKTASVTHT